MGPGPVSTSFRHTCAAILFERGLNVKQVQRWLGHHSASFTLDTYNHLLDEGLPRAHRAIGRAVATSRNRPPWSSPPTVDPAETRFDRGLNVAGIPQSRRLYCSSSRASSRWSRARKLSLAASPSTKLRACASRSLGDAAVHPNGSLPAAHVIGPCSRSCSPVSAARNLSGARRTSVGQIGVQSPAHVGVA